MPPQVREVEMETKQRKAYDLLKKELTLPSEDGGEPLLVKNPLELATRLVQAAAGVPMLEEHNLEDGTTVVKVVALGLPSAKWSAMLDILADTKGEPIVVFAESRLLIDLIAGQLEKTKVSYVRITGAEAPGLTNSRQVSLGWRSALMGPGLKESLLPEPISLFDCSGPGLWSRIFKPWGGLTELGKPGPSR